ncbi:hypothetical protein, partial [Pseudomonas coronafaciens]|uniref:hypothetical protein n=3 Tax=Pseudomonas coronafaciens TaxID=53409 RepID=UPI001CC1DDEF
AAQFVEGAAQFNGHWCKSFLYNLHNRMDAEKAQHPSLQFKFLNSLQSRYVAAPFSSLNFKECLWIK